MSKYYILNDVGDPEPADSMAFARWWNTHSRRIDLDFIGDCRVSTVFLGSDHQWINGGPPLIFETMVFRGPLAGSMDRYSTRAEALAGHARMVERVRAAIANKEGA